jgi:hypothetical protein
LPTGRYVAAPFSLTIAGFSRSIMPSVAMENTEPFTAQTGPRLLRGWASSWPAMQKWTPRFFTETYGHLLVEVRRSRPAAQRNMTVAEYFSTVHELAGTQDGWYLSDWKIVGEIATLRQDYQVPSAFKCWTERLPVEQNPELRWLYIGPAGSGKPLHRDVMTTAAWNAVISGQKRWRFYSVDQAPFLYGGAVDAFAPDLKAHPLFSEASAIEFVQGPGDLVYTPSGWWHQVKNVDACISVTENFVNELDIEAVMTELLARGETRWLQLAQAFGARP